jgi:apolipoprotein N-acyltransferase
MLSTSAPTAAEPGSLRRLRGWHRWAAAILSAILLELPFPIAGPMPPWRGTFAWFALVPLLWAVLSHLSGEDKDAARPHPTDEDLSVGTPRVGHPGGVDVRHPLRRAFLLAYVCGVLWYIGNCYWIYDTMLLYGDLPPVVSALILVLFSLVLGLYFGLFGLGIAFVQKKTGSTRWALAFAPFLWTALELAGARITSVPWDQLGYSQVDGVLANMLAPWSGVYGISFILVAANALIAGRFLTGIRSRDRRLRGIALNGAGWAVVLIALVAVTTTGAPFVEAPTTATAVLIQPNLDVGNTGYWQGPGEWDAYMAEFTRLAEESCKSYINGIPQTDAPTINPTCPPDSTHPDLVVWPESPAPFFEQDPRFERSMSQIARTVDAPLVVNGVGAQYSPADGGRLDHVSAMIYNADGEEVGRYDKMHLVPWGEYVPFPKLFFFARKLTGKVSAFTPGTHRRIFALESADGQTHRYGVFICYEAVFADEVRQFAKLGAQVLVNASDDGWYGDTSAPWQHLNMTRMRAIENRRWLLRDTNNGVTAVIDPYGRVRQSIPRHQIDALPAQFAFRDDVTFYTAHGDVFAWLCAILSLGVVGWCIAKKNP